MNTWKENLEETKQHYIDWWNHKGIVLNMWEHFQVDVRPHGPYSGEAPVKEAATTGFGTGSVIPGAPVPASNEQKWFDPAWRADYLDWYVGHSCLKADMLPVANTQLGPGSMSAILGARFEAGDDTIWIHPDPDYTDDFRFDPEHPNYRLHKDLLRACKQKAQGHYYVGMPDLMEGIDVLAGMKGTDKVMMDIMEQPEVLEQQMQRINDAYFQVFDELYDIIKEENGEMAFCYFSSWAPGKMTKLQCDLSTMLSESDYRRFVQPFIRQQCERIPYTLYHLDGVGALHHLPALLEIQELKAIQWTPGVGEPQGGSPKWYDLYRKILAGGKSVLISWVSLPELRPLLEAIGTEGVHLEMDFHNEQEVEEAERIIAEVRESQLRKRGAALAVGTGMRGRTAAESQPLSVERPPLEEIIKQKILIFDGAMGTTVQAYHLTGTSGSNEFLTIERPEIISDIYRRFLAAGSDIITSNTFNAQRCSLPAPFKDRVREINIAAVRMARQLADAFTLANPAKPRYVLGGCGPTRETLSMEGTKLTFEELVAIYQEQVEAQLEAGVDGILNETIFDTVNCEAFLHAAMGAMQKTGIRVPICLSFTVRTADGYNMVGQNVIDFCKQLHPDYQVFSVGLNCNPDIPMVTELTRRLAHETNFYISVFPNAGIPDAHGVFPTQPPLFQQQMWPLFDQHLINIVGGCCGTNDGHMAALAALAEPAPGCFLTPHVPGQKPAAAEAARSGVASAAKPSDDENCTPLQSAVMHGKTDEAAAAAKASLEAGAEGGALINEMIAVMGVVGRRFEQGKAFVPQLLMAGKAMKSAMTVIKEYQQAHGANSNLPALGKVVVGTVKGDLHDIGKNLVISMLEGSGFEVLNLGVDVTKEKFVEALQETHAEILCMSALLTTTMTYMPEVIQALKEAGIRDQVKVMVGGAPVTQEFCDQIGADAYTENANQIVEAAKRLLGKS
ncbi:MAG: homocysteine S-methyltransferase family protein [Bacteroidales bacterium]|nr:homocysteine S-methyltransferase family protein [Bacteroidales bacterium]